MKEMDLIQEIFIHVQRKLSSFRGDSKFSTWLHRVAVNQVLMHLRKVKRSPLLDSADDEEKRLILEAIEASPGLGIADRLTLEDVINQLPEGYKAILLLHDYEGLEHEETAKVCGVSTGTSKSQLHKARKKARKLFTKKAKLGLDQLRAAQEI